MAYPFRVQQFLFEGFELVGVSPPGPGRHSAHIRLRGHFTDVTIDNPISVDFEFSMECHRGQTVEEIESAARAWANGLCWAVVSSAPKADR